MKKIAIVFGSDSDWPVMKKCYEALKEFDVGLEIHIEAMSAHRNPDRVTEFASSAKQNGFNVIISAAGMSNALSGAIAAHTTLPVIAVPLSSNNLGGMDSLLASVQMPPGIPVACVSIDGAKNAALLALQILAISDEQIDSFYTQYKSSLANVVAKKNIDLQKKIKAG